MDDTMKLKAQVTTRRNGGALGMMDAKAPYGMVDARLADVLDIQRHWFDVRMRMRMERVNRRLDDAAVSVVRGYRSKIQAIAESAEEGGTLHAVQRRVCPRCGQVEQGAESVPSD